MTKRILKVSGMHCHSCATLVEDALSEAGARNVIVKLDEKSQIAQVFCDFDGDKGAIEKVVEKQGYKVV